MFDLDVLLGPPPSLHLPSSQDEGEPFHQAVPEQVIYYACASAHSSAPGASCLIWSLSLLAW